MCEGRCGGMIDEKKLIDRLEKESHIRYEQTDDGYCFDAEHFIYTSDAIKIAKELAEEQKHDMVTQLAMMYAKNIYAYGVDVTKAWESAVQNHMALEKAYIRGRQDESDKFSEWQEEHKDKDCSQCSRRSCYQKGYADAKKELVEEQNNDYWIPISERLPESGVSVIISYKDRFLSQADGTCDGWYDATNMIWHLTDYEYSDNVEVIAWRERLTPYQPKGE